MIPTCDLIDRCNTGASLQVAVWGGSSVGQSSGLIIRRSQVRALPAPQVKPTGQGPFGCVVGQSRTTPLRRLYGRRHRPAP